MQTISRNGHTLEISEPYIYDEIETSALKDLPGPFGTVVDIGAHAGAFSLYMASRGAKRIFAFEPVNFGQLAANVQRNTLERTVFPLPLGISKTGGGYEFTRLSTDGQVGMMFYPHNIPCGARPTISVETLYEILKPFFPIDVLKIDVEGAEFNFLDEAAKPLLAATRYLHLELHDPAGLGVNWFPPEHPLRSELYPSHDTAAQELLTFLESCGFPDPPDPVHHKTFSRHNARFQENLHTS